MHGPSPGGQSALGSYIAQADRGATAIVAIYQAAAPATIDPKELAEAEQRLEQLPLDSVPAPAGLPPASWMPLRRNALFVGRDADLRVLAWALKAGGTAAVGQSTAVTGLGGIGKSQLASEFCYRYGQYFAGGVFWLPCADPEATPAEIAISGRQLHLHADFTNLPLDGQVNLVASAWHSELPRLLVFDNCEDEGVLETWLPRGGGCRVLVTSRRATYSPHLGVHEVSLGVLARTESLDLLRKHCPHLAPDDPALDAIAAELGDLPLALHLAGSYFRRCRRESFGQPAGYLEAVRRPDLLYHRSLTIEGKSPTGNDLHVARTFALSYDRLHPADEVDQMALTTLARAAWFAPGEPIPRALLRASAGFDGAYETAALGFVDGLARLRELGLIVEQAEGALVLHRLLTAFVRSAAADAETHREQVEAAVVAEAMILNQAGYPAPLLAWQPQLRFVAERAAESESEHAGVLFNELGYHLRMAADFLGARAAYERALAIDEKRLGPEHPNIARDVNNLGSVLQAQGDLAGARMAFERALAIDEQCFGPDHPRVAKRVNNLGLALHELDDLEGARAAFERALRIDESIYGNCHPEVATALSNLGSVLSDLGDRVGARAAFERALAIDEQSFGPNHPNVAVRVNNLGSVLKNLGDLAGARSAFERALQVFEKHLGPDHPNVAVLINNLGNVLQDLGDLEGAKSAYERAFRIDEQCFGPDHPKSAIRVNNLGVVLLALGERAGARAAFEQALAIDEQSFGPNHPNVAVRVNNLGSVLRALGNLAGARAAYERALRIDEQSFGPDHPKVARDVNNLGSVLRAQGDLPGARAASERALAIFERVLGSDHPRTRMVRSNLDSLGGG